MQSHVKTIGAVGRQNLAVDLVVGGKHNELPKYVIAGQTIRTKQSLSFPELGGFLDHL